MNLTEFDYDSFSTFNNSFHQHYEENGIFTLKSPSYNFEDSLAILDDHHDINYSQQFTDVISPQLMNYEQPIEYLMSPSSTVNLENDSHSSDLLTKNVPASIQPPQNLICNECGTSFQQTEDEAYYSHFNHCVRSVVRQHETLNRSNGYSNNPPSSFTSGFFSLNTSTSKGKQNCKTTTNHQKPIVNCSSLPIRVQCNLCGRKLFQHNLAVHNRIHTGEMPFNCGYCLRPFRTKSALRVHLRSHTGERPYTCPYCCYACITKPNLQRHITNRHDKSGRTVKLCALRNWR
ncbi:hypothetical protein ACQ4LE_000145 [Meloidogyne hapla]|uniref:C2H2-type domain-containing protein n=1 Tax=Meloidogyne hapla TaxID=6305 RepID=A0A1I8C256_MELHA